VACSRRFVFHVSRSSHVTGPGWRKLQLVIQGGSSGEVYEFKRQIVVYWSAVQFGFSAFLRQALDPNDITDRKRAENELQKAFDEIKKLKDQLFEENIALRQEIDQASLFEEIVGSSKALRNTLAQVARVAPTDSTVLITGEGKHSQALRRRLCVDRAAIGTSQIRDFYSLLDGSQSSI
jgi:transcriptional regulator of acetoin/glycerol metabolism